MYFDLFQSAPGTAAGAGVSALDFAKHATVVAPFHRLLPAVGDAYGREFLTLQLQPLNENAVLRDAGLNLPY